MKKTIRHFTPAEARRTLPLVKKIVADILTSGKQLRNLAENSNEDSPELNDELTEIMTAIKGFLNELDEIGCYFKDWNFEIGLIDFPAIIEGEEVYLCWRSDEADLEYYHGLNAGYAGRKRLPEACFEPEKTL